jgi:hypothetical protein
MRPTALILPFAFACTEYEVVDHKEPTTPGDTEEPQPEEDSDPPPPEGSPDLWWDPVSVDLGTLCGAGVSTVTLGNQGDIPLTIQSASLAGEGWALDPVELPATLEPGASLDLGLQAGAGEAVLTVESDDPDSPSIEIPLAASADAPPTVEITSPAEATVMPVGSLSELEAQVGDDATPVQELSVSWSSDVDGEIGTEPASAEGLAAQGWDAGLRSPGPHTVTVTVTDQCGNTATDSITLCQQAGYDEESLDLSTWHFEGSALYDTTNSWVELTEPVGTVSGTAFQTAASVSADNVEIEFSFYVSGGSGADGISLTALDVSRMTSFVGGTGGGIGYAGLPGWSIEVDTWYNSEHYDPTPEDHISLHFDGNINAPAAWAALPDMEDGRWHVMTVSVVAPHVKVAIDGVTYLDQDVSGYYSFPAYVGFTAATGGSTNYHLIDALLVTEYVCPE